MPELSLRAILAISIGIILLSTPVRAQSDKWWHGSFVSEDTAEALIKEGHARPFDCPDPEHVTTITAETISGYGFTCKITNVSKIPDYEIVIIKSDCKEQHVPESYKSYQSEAMFLLLEPAGRMLSYNRGRIGRHHLPYTNELSACERRD